MSKVWFGTALIAYDVLIQAMPSALLSMYLIDSQKLDSNAWLRFHNETISSYRNGTSNITISASFQAPDYTAELVQLQTLAKVYLEAKPSRTPQEVKAFQSISARTSGSENSFECATLPTTYSPTIFCSGIVTYPFYLANSNTLEDLENLARLKATGLNSFMSTSCLADVKRLICATVYQPCVSNGRLPSLPDVLFSIVTYSHHFILHQSCLMMSAPSRLWKEVSHCLITGHACESTHKHIAIHSQRR